MVLSEKSAIFRDHALVAAAGRGCGARPTGSGAAFALRLFAGELAGAADGFGLLAGALLRRLLVIVTELHLAEDAFALHFLLQRPEGLIDIVIANDDLHAPMISDWPLMLGMEAGA